METKSGFAPGAEALLRSARAWASPLPALAPTFHLGWPVERIIVIDSDLGQSAATAADREGFQRLVTEGESGKSRDRTRLGSLATCTQLHGLAPASGNLRTHRYAHSRRGWTLRTRFRCAGCQIQAGIRGQRQAAHQGQPPNKPLAGFSNWADPCSFQVTQAVWLAQAAPPLRPERFKCPKPSPTADVIP